MKQEKIWFVLEGEQKTGPYSIEELQCIKYFTPDTLVWKEGFLTWKKAGDVEELSPLFEEDSQGEKKPSTDEELELSDFTKPPPSEDLTMTLRQEPPPMLIYFLLLLIVLFTLLYNR